MERTGPVSTANIVHTPELLEQLLEDELPCWTWAAFASVVFQRWAALEERKVDQVLGVRVRPVGRLRTGTEVARFALGHMRAVDDVVAEVGVFLSSRSFAAAFGSPDDEGTADAEGIVRSAHRLGDFYERLLELAEECRRYSVPAQYANVVRDCLLFVDQHLQDFGGFVNDVLERLEVVQERVTSGRSCARWEPLELHTSVDDRVIWSILDCLRAIE